MKAILPSCHVLKERLKDLFGKIRRQVFPLLAQKGHGSIKVADGLLGLRKQRLHSSMGLLWHPVGQNETADGPRLTTQFWSAVSFLNIYNLHNQHWSTFCKMHSTPPGTSRCRQRRHRQLLGTRQSAPRSEHLAWSFTQHISHWYHCSILQVLNIQPSIDIWCPWWVVNNIAQKCSPGKRHSLCLSSSKVSVLKLRLCCGTARSDVLPPGWLLHLQAPNTWRSPDIHLTLRHLRHHRCHPSPELQCSNSQVATNKMNNLRHINYDMVMLCNPSLRTSSDVNNTDRPGSCGLMVTCRALDKVMFSKESKGISSLGIDVNTCQYFQHLPTNQPGIQNISAHHV